VAASAVDADGGHAPSSPEDVVRGLLEGNARFRAGHPRTRDLVASRAQLAEGQHPGAIILSCSDSRVPPEMVFDQTLGDLFVVRVAGNVADTIALASIEYAAEHLHARVIVVLGHEKCGAVTAAATGAKMPSVHLQALVDEISPALLKREPTPGAALVHQGVEANVAATAAELLERSPILKEEAHAGKLRIVMAVYDLASGEVRVLPDGAVSP
jgi:carbonic anhydrase